jgi:hypothetical protein
MLKNVANHIKRLVNTNIKVVPNKSRFKRNDYLILGAPAALCFLLWIRQNDQKYMQPVRDQRNKGNENSSNCK